MRQNWTFTLSLILHGLIAWWLLHAKPMPIPEAPIQIDIVDQDKDKKDKAVVMDPSLGEVLKQVKDQAKRWSKENRRVQKEMSALGLEQRNAAQGGNNLMMPEPQPQQRQPRRNDSNYDQQPQSDQGIKVGQQTESKLNPLLQSSGALRSVVTGQSTRGEFIPGLEQGSFTALNTDQFTYYTFFSRMNEQIRPRWVSRLRDFAYSQNQMQMQQLAQYPRTTQVEFILDKTGKLLETIVHLTSGYKALDLAGTEAFREAAPINNPPQGLVEADGKIHLHYNFSVHWRE